MYVRDDGILAVCVGDDGLSAVYVGSDGLFAVYVGDQTYPHVELWPYYHLSKYWDS